MQEIKLKEVSNAALAYLGDCVFELCVREYLVESGYSSSQRLNEKALSFVRASEQAKAVQKILPYLDEDETAVFKRGRNAAHSSMPKSATAEEYRLATGIEALFGYLHLIGRYDRIKLLFRLAYDLD